MMAVRTARVLAAWCVVLLACGAAAQSTSDSKARIEAGVAELVAELVAICPVAEPADQVAFDGCRRALFHDSLLHRRLSTILLWGRPNPKPGELLKDTTLTQLAPEVWAGLYAPMFMFDGTWTVEYHEGERLYRSRLGARFRNALAPGQYPYPFWHSAKKWDDYQNADTVVFWINPDSGSIVVGQFTNEGRQNARLKNPPVVRPPFDGRWMWTDPDGTVQPQPALFQGLFANDNPYLTELEPLYRDLANAMRKGHCNDCHVPDNPNRMNRLVLLQTPAHAASEIKRLMNAIRRNDMPVDDSLLPLDLEADTRAALLQYGAAFEAVVDAAREWEQTRYGSR
jgi:hypothetical protein